MPKAEKRLYKSVVKHFGTHFRAGRLHFCKRKVIILVPLYMFTVQECEGCCYGLQGGAVPGGLHAGQQLRVQRGEALHPHQAQQDLWLETRAI
jgi:hypothetical protein